MEQTVSFIGLGAMGYRMAAHLPKKFKNVLVYNRTTEKAEQHAKQYGTQTVSLEQATQADIIFSCLPTSREVEHIIQSHPPKANAIWVDCTSGEPNSAKMLAEFLQQHQAYYLDAPVSGQTIGAENATLTVMVGGDKTAFDQALPAIACFGKLIKHVGESGAGFSVKAINNMLMAINFWSLAEGLTALKANGVELNAALECINASSGQSKVSQTIYPQRVLNRSFPLSFALPLLAKDTRIATSIANEHQLPIPVMSLVQNLIQTANLTQDGDCDFSSAAKLYEQWTKITLE